MRIFVLFALIALASGCPKQRATGVSTQVPPVTSGPATIVTPGALPPGWPSIVPIYTQSAVVEGRSTESSGAPLLTAILTTPDAPEKVHEFYGQKLSPYQFTVVSSSETKGEKVSLYRRDGQSLSVSTTLDAAQKQTQIELTLAGKYEPRAGEPPAAKQDPPAKKSEEEKQEKEEPKGETTHPMLPLYPGTKGETELDGTRVTLRLSTKDSVEQVVAFYEQFYKSQGLESAGRSEFGAQVSQRFSGPSGTAQLNVSGGSTTSINLSYQGTAPPAAPIF